MKISVIIPTHNRQDKLKETVGKLRDQDFPTDEYEIIVVDDGSTPPVTLAEDFTISPQVSIIRLEGVERSIARNTGAKNATGELLVFVDNDVLVEKKFLLSHWQAHQKFPLALIVGAIHLPPEKQNIPFVRFRQSLEQQVIPREYGLVDEANFCTAQNMAIARSTFAKLNGFEEYMVSSEDQDFALRHTAHGGKIAYLPEALGIHNDSALDIRTYCRRTEWGSRLMLPFYCNHPNLPNNIELERINGFSKWGNESVLQSIRKFFKRALASSLAVNGLFLLSDICEKVTPNSKLLNKTYRLLLGSHIFRGYRAAMKAKE